jgi:hypothetical protein
MPAMRVLAGMIQNTHLDLACTSRIPMSGILLHFVEAIHPENQPFSKLRNCGTKNTRLIEQ